MKETSAKKAAKQFLADLIQKQPDSSYRDALDAAEAAGHKLSPVMWRWAAADSRHPAQPDCTSQEDVDGEFVDPAEKKAEADARIDRIFRAAAYITKLVEPLDEKSRRRVLNSAMALLEQDPR